MANHDKYKSLLRRTELRDTHADTCDEMFSQQTGTLSAAIVETYRNGILCGYDELVVAGEIISQGRYWHGI